MLRGLSDHTYRCPTHKHLSECCIGASSTHCPACFIQATGINTNKIVAAGSIIKQSSQCMLAHSTSSAAMLEVTTWRHMGHGKPESRPMHPEQEHMCPRGCRTTLAGASQHMMHSAPSSMSCIRACSVSADAGKSAACRQGSALSETRASPEGVDVWHASARGGWGLSGTAVLLCGSGTEVAMSACRLSSSQLAMIAAKGCVEHSAVVSDAVLLGGTSSACLTCNKVAV